jgi:tetratricopeptide (TPR) repeat protein
VQACPPSAWYRFRKFARRKKMALAMAACVFLALAGIAGGIGWAARDRAANEEAGARQAQEALTAARTFFGENRLDLARPKLAEAQALLGAHHVAPGSLAGEIETLEAELVRFEQFFALIDQAHQAEIPSPTEVAVAVQSFDGTAAVLSSKSGQEREPAKAVPFLRKALALYQALGQNDWNTVLEQGALGRHQVEQIRRTAYGELLWLADDILARREDHESGEQLSAPAAARQALAYLDKAGAGHEPTTAYFSLRARCRGALGDKEAADADLQLARATQPTLGLDHDLLGQAGLDAKDKDVAVREFEEALRLEPTHYWSLMKLGQSFNDLGEGPADYAAAVAVYTGCIMKRPDFAPAYRYRAVAHGNLKQHEKSVQDCSKAIELDPKYVNAWTIRGIAYRGLHQYDKALADLNKAIELDPKYVNAWTIRGNAYRGLHQYDKALADLNKAIELDPKLAPAWNDRGIAYFDLHQHDKALADYSKAIELDPKLAAAWTNRGAAYGDLHQYDKALADLNKAIELGRKFAQVWNNRGYTYNQLHQYDKAIVDYSKAIELDPKFPLAWSNRGSAYNKLHQYDEAFADLNKAIQLDPKFAQGWCGRGAAYGGLRQYEKALADSSKAIELDPKLAAAWTIRGAAYSGLHQYDKALADQNKAIELDPKHAAAWNNRGAVYCDQLHQFDKAVADFSKAIELDPKDAGAWYNRGNAYHGLRQYDKALADHSEAIELDPKFAPAWNNRGGAYWNLHQYDKALADYSKAIELDPTYARPCNGLAWLFATCPDPRFRDAGKAVGFAKKAVKLAPTDGGAWNTLGTAQYCAGEWKLAVEALNKSMDLRKGGDSWDWFFLAMAHWKLGEKDKARQWYEKAVQWMEKNNPQDDELRRFRAEAEELLGIEKPGNPEPELVPPPKEAGRG